MYRGCYNSNNIIKKRKKNKKKTKQIPLGLFLRRLFLDLFKTGEPFRIQNQKEMAPMLHGNHFLSFSKTEVLPGESRAKSFSGEKFLLKSGGKFL